MTCWICDSEDVVYTDAIGAQWCRKHYQQYFEQLLRLAAYNRAEQE